MKNIKEKEKTPQKTYSQPGVISKTFQSGGHWIEKPNKTPILVCECGNKYLKTRAAQSACLRCMSRARISGRER